jgi:hypothetical protein
MCGSHVSIDAYYYAYNLWRLSLVSLIKALKFESLFGHCLTLGGTGNHLRLGAFEHGTFSAKLSEYVWDVLTCVPQYLS